MISVVCVYNKESTFNDVLLKSLRSQTAAYDLVALDNRAGRFHSAAEAYNHGGAQAKGDYVMFVHQDLWLVTRTWLEDAERVLKGLPSLGVAGVAGMVSMSEKSRTSQWASASCFYLDETTVVEHDAIRAPVEVETLDECLLLVPRPVFDKLKFDEATFDGWDCYAADYCLCAKTMGLKAYVIPAPCSHCCVRSTFGRWELKGLLKYQKRLYTKHRNEQETICTWMGDVNRHSLRSWSWEIRIGSLLHRMSPNSDTFLARELAGCETALDLDCGYRSSAGRYGFRSSIGLDSSEPYLRESRRRAVHKEYVKADISFIPFRPKSFDVIIAVETLDRLTREEGAALLRGMEELARKRVVVTTSNRHLEHRTDVGHGAKEHKPGWEAAELVSLGFKVRGSGGWQKVGWGMSKMKHKSAIVRVLASIRQQLRAYYRPDSADQLTAVKHVDSVKGPATGS
jgi:hypothetical protein